MTVPPIGPRSQTEHAQPFNAPPAKPLEVPILELATELVHLREKEATLKKERCELQIQLDQMQIQVRDAEREEQLYYMILQGAQETAKRHYADCQKADTSKELPPEAEFESYFNPATWISEPTAVIVPVTGLSIEIIEEDDISAATKTAIDDLVSFCPRDKLIEKVAAETRENKTIKQEIKNLQMQLQRQHQILQEFELKKRLAQKETERFQKLGVQCRQATESKPPLQIQAPPVEEKKKGIFSSAYNSIAGWFSKKNS